MSLMKKMKINMLSATLLILSIGTDLREPSLPPFVSKAAWFGSEHRYFLKYLLYYKIEKKKKKRWKG